jgi:hypothetical protein
MQNASKIDSAASSDEMPIKLLYVAIIGAAIVLAVIAVTSVESVGLIRGIGMAVLGTLWIWMSGIILSEAIGRTNWSPLSGMTLIGITLLIILTHGMERGDSIVAAIMVGAATLGSERLPAPQGQALASMVEGILGGDVPTQKYAAGAVLGGLLSTVIGGLGITVGLGFYLPFNIVLTYSLGTLSRELADRYKGRSWSEGVGIPIAAGLIVGEALIGVGYAIKYVLSAA